MKKDKGHCYFSTIKSAVRVMGCIITLFTGSIIILAAFFGIAEILGVFEEVVDER